MERRLKNDVDRWLDTFNTIVDNDHTSMIEYFFNFLSIRIVRFIEDYWLSVTNF